MLSKQNISTYSNLASINNIDYIYYYYYAILKAYLYLLIQISFIKHMRT